MAKKEKKEKKKKIKIPLTAKQIAIIMAIICLVSFLYKFTIGIMSLSMVLMIPLYQHYSFLSTFQRRPLSSISRG